MVEKIVTRPPEKRKAIPLPEGIIDPEALDKALKRYAQAVREDKWRLPEDTPQRPRWIWYEPLDSPM